MKSKTLDKLLWRLNCATWRYRMWVRYPRSQYASWRKQRNLPKIGDRVQDCRYEIHTVIAVLSDNDTLVFEDGRSASWMYCCDPVEDETHNEQQRSGDTSQP